MIGFIYTYSNTRIGGIETYNCRIKQQKQIDCSLSLYENNEVAIVKFFKIVFVTIAAKKLILSHINLLPIAYFRFIFGFKKTYIIVHGTEVWRKLPKMSSFVAKFIPVSDFTREVIKRRNHGRNFVFTRVLSNSFDNFSPTSFVRKRSNKFLLVSRLDIGDNYKGVDCVIKGMKILKELSIDASLTIVGKGDDYTRLYNLMDSLNLENIDFVPFVPNLKDAFESHDVFILPSSGEGFGIVYLEALNFGLNIIALDKGAQFDFLKDYSGFFSVENQDPTTIAVSMMRALENIDINSNLSSGNLIKEKYDEKKFKFDFGRIFNSVVEIP